MIDIAFGHGSITDRDDYLRRALKKHQTKTSDLHDICILEGDPELLIELTNRSPSKVSHYNILLSIDQRPADFPTSQSLKMLHLFKQYCIHDLGYERNEVYMNAIEHRDKTCVHIHATIPNISLITGKPLNFFYPAKDQFWKNNINELLDHHFFVETQYSKLKLVVFYSEEQIASLSAKMQIREKIRAYIAQQLLQRFDALDTLNNDKNSITFETVKEFVQSIPYVELIQTQSKISLSVKILNHHLPKILLSSLSADLIDKALEKPIALKGQVFHNDFNLATYEKNLTACKSRTKNDCLNKHAEYCKILRPLRGPKHNNPLSGDYEKKIGAASGILSYISADSLNKDIGQLLSNAQNVGFHANSKLWELPTIVYDFKTYNDENTYGKKKKDVIRNFYDELRAWIFKTLDKTYMPPEPRQRKRKKSNLKTKPLPTPIEIEQNQSRHEVKNNTLDLDRER